MHLRTRPLASSTLRNYDRIRRRTLSPRVRLATRLWAAGLGTKKHIAKAIGISPITLYINTMPSLPNPDSQTTVQRIHDMIENETVEIGKALKLAGRRAVKTLVNTMEVGSSEILRFKAAQDLADRSPETSKTQKVAVTSFSLTSDDVKELARSLTEAHRGRAEFADAVKHDVVRVDVDRHEELPEHAKRLEAADAARRQTSSASSNVGAKATDEADEREDPPRDATHDGQGA